MKNIVASLSLCLLALLVASSASAQAWGGAGRIHGVVLDEKGKPIAGARVKLVSIKAGSVGPEPIVTDAKGKWAALGVIGGRWNVDIEAEGYLPRALSADVSELNRLTPPMRVQLQPKPVEQPKQQEQEQAREAVVVGGVEISPETAKSIEAANAFVKEEKWAEATAEYEKALSVLPDNMQLKAALARAYYGLSRAGNATVIETTESQAGNKSVAVVEVEQPLEKAISLLREVHNADTGHVVYATLLADMLLENEQIDEAKKVLAAIPAGALTDPNTVINIGVRFINNARPEDAWTWFNDAVLLAPDLPAAYYYRAIASLQMKKMNEAKADLQKVVSLAPDGPEAGDAKELLAQMK